MARSGGFRNSAIVLALSGASVAFASDSDPSDCGSGGPGLPFPAIVAQISDAIAPLKEAYLNLNAFELDPLSADLAALENEVDPPAKRKTLTFLARYDRTRRKSERSDWTYGAETPVTFQWSKDGKTLHLSETTYLIENGLDGSWWGSSGSSAKDLSLDQVRKLSFDDLKKELWGDEKAFRLPQYTEANLELAAAYLKVVSQPDRAGIQATLAELKDQLTSEQKIQLVRYVGGVSNEHYDHERASSKDAAKNQGTPALSKNFGAAIPYENILMNLRTENRLGVCRDIVVAQAQMLRQLGFENVYTVSYSSGGNHAAVLAQDPSDKKKVLHFNYSLLEEAPTLTRSMDYSTVYELADYRGKTVANLPSELGTLMAEGAGANLRTLDPFLYRPQGSIVKLSWDGKDSQIPVFVGQTTSGDRIVGAGYTLRKGDPEKDVLSASGTAALAYQNRRAQPYSDKTVTVDALHLNGMVSGQLASRWKDLGKSGTQGRATLTETLGATQSKTHLSEGAELATSTPRLFRNQTEAGVEAKYQSADGKTQVKGRVASQWSVGTSDVSAGGYDRVYHNVSYARVTGETVVLPEKLKATMDAAVGLREFGPQVFTQVGVKETNDRWKASAGYQGSLKKDALTIAPGSERQVFADFEKRLGRSMSVSASYLQPTGLPLSEGRVQAGVKGSLTEILKKK